MSEGYNQFFRKARARQNHLKMKPSKANSASKVSPMISHVKVKQKSRVGRVHRRALGGVVFIVFLSFIFGLSQDVSLESLDRILHSVDVRLFGSALAESTQGKKDPENSKLEETSSSTPDGGSSDVLQKKTNWTTEELTLFEKLEERKQNLDLKESELVKLDVELQKQKVEVEKKLRELESLRAKIAQQLEVRVSEDQERVDKLVLFYSNMKPQSAAKVFEQINEDLAVEVLTKMKQKNAAEILNLLPADKSQRLSEKFAGYKRK